jgi:hypothetical protein
LLAFCRNAAERGIDIMGNGDSVSARRCWIVVAAVAALATAIPATAQTGSRPVTIPPAELPPAGDTGAPDAEAASSRPTMRALLPSNVQILRDSHGTGLVMYGPLAGKAESAHAALQGIFTYSQAFDPRPVLTLVVADMDDRHAQGLFTAIARGTPVTGIAVVSLTDTGGDVSVFYDNADGFAASFDRMRKALAEGGGADIVLSPLHLGDGSQIGLPPGWRLIGQGAGLVDVMGTQGEFVSLGASTPVHARPAPLAGNTLQGPCCDPVRALQAVYPQLNANAQHLGSPSQQLTEIVEAQPTPASNNGEGAFILSKLSVGGRPYGYFARVAAIGGFTDPWTLTLSGVTAPQSIFATEFPTLLQIWRSYSGSLPGFADQLTQALQNMPATQRIIQSASVPRRTGEYDAASGWNQVLTAAPTEEQAQVDDARARKLVEALSSETGRPWRIVPDRN